MARDRRRDPHEPRQLLRADLRLRTLGNDHDGRAPLTGKLQGGVS
jgi:hypothetical protein